MEDKNILAGNHTSWVGLFQRSILWETVIHCGALTCSAWTDSQLHCRAEMKQGHHSLLYNRNRSKSTHPGDVRWRSISFWEGSNVYFSTLTKSNFNPLNWSIQGLKQRVQSWLRQKKNSNNLLCFSHLITLLLPVLFILELAYCFTSFKLKCSKVTFFLAVRRLKC